MSWMLFLQIVLLTLWLTLLVNTAVNHVISHYWEARMKMAKAIGSVNEVKGIKL